MIDAKVVLLLSHKKSTYHHALDTLCLNEKWSFYFKNYSNPRYFFTIEEYKELLINAGLEVVSLNEKAMTHQFDSIQALKGFLSASMAQVKEIPLPMKETFLDDFCIEFLTQKIGNTEMK